MLMEDLDQCSSLTLDAGIYVYLLILGAGTASNACRSFPPP
jgi:hypothetical protein